MERAARVIAKLRQSGVSREELVLSAWTPAIGKRLSGKARAGALYGSRLVVEVEDEVWRSNLMLLRGQILDNLGKILGSRLVDSIEFRVRAQVPRRGPATEQHLARIDDADGITDPVFRLVYRAARKKASA